MLSNGVLVGALGVGWARSAPLAAIAMPEITDQPLPWQIERLSRAEARQRLLMSIHGSATRSTVFRERPAVANEYALTRIADTIPVFRLLLGATAPSQPADALWNALGWN